MHDPKTAAFVNVDARLGGLEPYPSASRPMPETSSPATVAARYEYAAAFLLLRLFLGLRTLQAGIDKFESKGTYSLANYSENTGRIATGITGASYLPLWATRAFALSLGYVLILVGAALLLGIRSRPVLVLAGLVYLALSFGLMVVQESEGVAQLGIHVGLIAAALVLVRHERFALWRDKSN